MTLPIEKTSHADKYDGNMRGSARQPLQSSWWRAGGSGQELRADTDLLLATALSPPCDFVGGNTLRPCALVSLSPSAGETAKGYSTGIENSIFFPAIGAIAGWLAGLIVKGYGFGLLGNIGVGIVGTLVAGLLFPRLGFAIGGEPWIGSIVSATLGAVILLLLIRLVRRAA